MLRAERADDARGVERAGDDTDVRGRERADEQEALAVASTTQEERGSADEQEVPAVASTTLGGQRSKGVPQGCWLCHIHIHMISMKGNMQSYSQVRTV